MYTASIKNSAGSSLQLTQNESRWQVVKITGLNPAPAQVNTMNVAGLDGAKFNSSKLGTRNIVVLLRLRGLIETNRLAIYDICRTKDWCRFFYKNGKRDVYIDGYIDEVESDLFVLGEVVQISIICPNPYFKAVDASSVGFSDTITDLFKFPFAINYDDPVPFSEIENADAINVRNDAESETGVVVNIVIMDACSEIAIANTTTGEMLTIEGSYLAKDRIIIDTNKGNKGMRLVRDGVTSNIFSNLVRGSVFFQLATGDNIFQYEVDGVMDSAKAEITMDFTEQYRGV